MKPYFQDKYVTIYHGDCREILPSLGKFDLLLTDPPYGVDFNGKTTKHTKGKTGYISGDNDLGPSTVRHCLGQCDRGAVFSGIRLMFKYPEPEDIGCVFCPSGAGVGKWGFAMYHPVLFYGKRPSYQGSRPASIQWTKQSEQNGHPCPKPIEWMKWCISLAGDPQTILDPFAGSGTTGRAAKDMGKQCTLIEREEKYCEIAAKRMAQEILDFGEMT